MAGVLLFCQANAGWSLKETWNLLKGLALPCDETSFTARIFFDMKSSRHNNNLEIKETNTIPNLSHNRYRWAPPAQPIQVVGWHWKCFNEPFSWLLFECQRLGCFEKRLRSVLLPETNQRLLNLLSTRPSYLDAGFSSYRAKMRTFFSDLRADCSIRNIDISPRCWRWQW